MELTYSHCVGLDVHKKTVVVCCMTSEQIGTFSTMTQFVGTMWLVEQSRHHVAIGLHRWILETSVQPARSQLYCFSIQCPTYKNVPGRKTDVKDAEWITATPWFNCGSFIPPLPQRDLRDLTRQRTNKRARKSQCGQSPAHYWVGELETGISGYWSNRCLGKKDAPSSTVRWTKQL